MIGNCDSTQIDKNIDFDWGNYGPAFASFPNEYFSVLWRGEIRSTTAGKYKFYANAKNGIRLYIDANLIIDEWSAASSEVSGEIMLKANTFYAIKVEYREVTAKASVKLSWLVPESSKKNVIPSTSLYYTRHLVNSPMLVVVYPGFIDAHTTNATGPALSNGIALSETSFTIQARDTEANYRYNGGADTFTLALTGITDWAGQGRTDEVTSGIPHTISLNQSSREWTLLCSACATGTLGSYFIDVNTDLRSTLKRGEEFVIGNGKRYGERFQVHVENEYTSTKIPMNSKYVSPTTASQNIYKVGPTTGTHRVWFTPKVRGSYRLDVIVPADRRAHV
jgi:hypothetical protein